MWWLTDTNTVKMLAVPLSGEIVSPSIIYAALLAVVAILAVRFIIIRREKHRLRETINFFIHAIHDIRTHTALIQAPLSELENENLTDRGKQTLAIAAKSTQKLLLLATQLLDVRRATLSNININISEKELYSFMNEKMADFRPIAMQKNIALKMTADFNHLKVYFDRDGINTVMDNLLSNAIKYTPAGGSVTVTLSHDSNNWSAEVRDTGIGIPPADRKNIFRQFFRAGNAVDSKEGGSGTGLFLSKKIVTLHRGTIRFSNAENNGTVFQIVIPFGKTDEEEDDAILIGESEQKADTSLKKILLVEDDDNMRAYLKNILIREYRVVDLPDGRTVCQQIADINPDIVISDVLMPYLRGDDLCRMLKSDMKTSHIPVILLTALSEREDIIKALESSADDCITKPFDTAVLKARIRNILQNREKLHTALSSVSGSVPDEETGYTNELDRMFMEKATALMEKEMSNTEFSINDFCIAMGMSRSSFYNKLKALTGRAPNDFIRLIRLNKAHDLLASRRHNVSEVADMVGFPDAKYFSTSFKKQFGISPSKVAAR